MAGTSNVGTLTAFLNGLPTELKKTLTQYTEYAFKNISFGETGEGVTSAGNFKGVIVPFVTSASSGTEIAVAHGLERIPKVMYPMLPPLVVNATIPVLTVTRAADTKFFYVSSATTGASVWMYVE